MINVLVVDYIPGTCANLARLLEFEDDMRVVGEAGNGLYRAIRSAFE